MKKLLALLLALLMMFSFVACEKDSDKDTDKDDDKSSVTDKNDGSGEKEDDDKELEFVFEETVVVDNDECLIKITDIDSEDFFGYTLKAELENKSSDKTYVFSVDSASVNGVQCSPLFYSEIAAGKKAKEDISFGGDQLEEKGITEYTDIELTFRVYDSEDWMADDIAVETVNIYPYGEENATKFVRESKDTDNVIMDNEYAKVTVIECGKDEFWGYTASLYIENKSDKTLMISADDVAVNGYMADPLFATSVSEGKVAFSSMSWSDETFEENGITDVEEIEFTLTVTDADDWLADSFAEEVITLNP